MNVPSDFKFTVDGRQLTVGQLQPGMKLTAVISTTTTPKTVSTTKIRNGEVVKVSGSTLMYREGGQVKSITVPAGYKFVVDGAEKTVQSLTPGMRLTAEVVTTSAGVDVTRTTEVSGSTPPPPPPPPPAQVAQSTPPPPPAPEPEPEPEPELPKTAGPLPLIGLLGAALTAAGVLARRMAR